MKRHWTLRCLLVAAILCCPSLLGLPAAPASSSPEPYDFNGDGLPDLAIGAPGDRVRAPRERPATGDRLG